MKFLIDPSWLGELSLSPIKDALLKLEIFLGQEMERGKIIYPPQKLIFEALRLTPYQNVKVIIIGQDPYHGPLQAHGLSFSVANNQKIPPSLQNIFKELQTDLGHAPAKHGNLERWANQGVLLLNYILTVEQGLAGSHQGKGWESITEHIIKTLNNNFTHLVFILWGAQSQKLSNLINEKKHLVLSSPHPSPLSCYRGFYGSKPFSKTNHYLISKGIHPIDWSLL